jgi:uncharacterized protein YjaG (DUF416 family)
MELLMLRGKYFIEAKPSSHDMVTMTAFKAIKACPLAERAHSGLPMSDITVSGLTKMVHINTLSINTTTTLLRSSESFLNTSKNPRLIDDITASKIHMVPDFGVQRYEYSFSYALFYNYFF